MPTGKRILVVDDEPEIVELLTDILSDHRHEVHSASLASEALELVRANIYDAAILDFSLPDMNGVMLHRQIRQMDEELAAATLFISGLEQSDEHIGYYSEYGYGFLSKPFDVVKVLEALNSLWEDPEA